MGPQVCARPCEECPAGGAVGLQIQNSHPPPEAPKPGQAKAVVQATPGLGWGGPLLGGPVPSRGPHTSHCSHPGFCGRTGGGSAEAGIRVPRRKGTAGVALRGQRDGKGPGLMGRKGAG